MTFLDLIFIQILFAVANIGFAYFNSEFIALQDYSKTDYKTLSNEWHFNQGLIYCILALIASLEWWLGGGYTVTIGMGVCFYVAIIFNRAIFFPYILNLLMNNGFFYLGSGSWDTTMKSVLGKNAAVISFCVEILALVTSNYLLYSWMP